MDQQNKLFIGNLDFTVTSDEIREFFSQFGTVTDATVVVDKFSGRSRGFGFVTFETSEMAEAAKNEANEKEFKNRKLIVSSARPRQDSGSRPQHGGGGDRGGFRRDFRH